jgi:hypothetical protein
MMRVHLMCRIFVLAGILLGCSAASCSTSMQNKEISNSDPDFVGFVTTIDRGGTGEVIGRLTVESHADKLVNRHVVTITRSTVLRRREGEALKPVNLDALKARDWVQLWFSGSPTKPYPQELTAQRLIIIDRP